MKLRLRISVFILIISVISVISIISCGVEENYYLPQVSEGNISRTGNYGAVINIPPISDDLYYATHYTIFYRIYLSSHNASGAYITQNDMRTISSSLYSDYTYLLDATDPTKTSSTFTFTDYKKYFEIDFEGAGKEESKLSKAGGTLSISFPTIGTGSGIPFVTINGKRFNLLRSSSLISPIPDDRYFQNTSELRGANTSDNVNADVADHSNPQFAYVSMYIAASGTNQSNFNQIFSKPTHISVFRLTDIN